MQRGSQDTSLPQSAGLGGFRVLQDCPATAVAAALGLDDMSGGIDASCSVGGEWELVGGIGAALAGNRQALGPQPLVQFRVDVAEGQLRRLAGDPGSDQGLEFAGKGGAGGVLLARGRNMGSAVAGSSGKGVHAIDVRDIG